MTISEIYRGRDVWRFSGRSGYGLVYLAEILNLTDGGDAVVRSEEHGIEVVHIASLCKTREEALRIGRAATARDIEIAQRELEQAQSVMECLNADYLVGVTG